MALGGLRTRWIVPIVGALAACGAAQPILSESKVLNGSLLQTGGYLTTYNSTFGRDTSKGDSAGMLVDLRGLWSLVGQRFGSPVDWSGFNAFTVRIENLESVPVRLVVRFEMGPDPQDPTTKEQTLVVIPAGKTIRFLYDLDYSTVLAKSLRSNIMPYADETMKVVAAAPVRLDRIYSWQIYNRGTTQARVRLWDVKTVKINPDVTGAVDPFGQSSLGNWVDKVTGDGDLLAQRQAESDDLAANPGPGGLEGTDLLPRQGASSKWRVVRMNSGKWYFVHPSGRPFWSMGMTTVRYTEGTPVTGREGIFQMLPPRGGGSPFFETIVQGGQSIETVTFTGRNLERKYGTTWRDDYASMATRRLKSWGFNSLGDWVDPTVLSTTDIPYTIGVTSHGFPRRLTTTTSNRTLPDPFDPSFQSWMTNNIARAIAEHNGNPQFFGVYVDGELPWGGLESMRTRFMVAFQALNADSSQPAKRVFVSMLRRKYGSISRLNRSWRTEFPNWNSVYDPGDNLQSTMVADCREFTVGFANAYYRAVSQALLATNCTGLYLGSREGPQATPEFTAAANRYVDVFSASVYKRPEQVDWDFPGIDRPVIVSEFSFGATDRGQWNPGPEPTTDQVDRAEAMKSFFVAALQAPKVVGAHWFQYGDQHVSGRFDGENFNMGFLSVTDTPYPEMVAASRLVGANLYLIRGQ